MCRRLISIKTFNYFQLSSFHLFERFTTFTHTKFLKILKFSNTSFNLICTEQNSVYCLCAIEWKWNTFQQCQQQQRCCYVYVNTNTAEHQWKRRILSRDHIHINKNRVDFARNAIHIFHSCTHNHGNSSRIRNTRIHLRGSYI